MSLIERPPAGRSPGEAPPSGSVRIGARLDNPSRGLWIVKFLLLIPHFVVLALLGLALVPVWFASLVCIVATGRLPRVLFDYSAGVMRWTWRVQAYGTGLFATDVYPPFTLADVPDYPARLEIDYPEHLSRGLPFVKWLLAVPHLILCGLLFGGIAQFSQHDGNLSWGSLGVVELLALVAGVILLFTRTYPSALFDLLVGFHRWGARVGAYVLLLTDEYPPFRLDTGGEEHGAPALTTPLTGPLTGGRSATGTASARPTWTAGTITAVVTGSVLALLSGAVLFAGGGALWADRTARDGAGYLTTPVVHLHDASYAITAQSIHLGTAGPDWARPSAVLGTVRIRFTGSDPTTPMFVGVAPQAAVASYLANSEYVVLDDTSSSDPSGLRRVNGRLMPQAPTTQSFWTATATGAGPQELTWRADGGDWALVAMRADGGRGVDLSADIAAQVPSLGTLGVSLLAAGAAGLTVATALVVVPLTAGSRRRPKASAPAA